MKLIKNIKAELILFLILIMIMTFVFIRFI